MKITIEYDDGLPFAAHELGADDADAWLALFEDSPGKTTGFVGTAPDSRAREFAESLVDAARAAKRNLEAGRQQITAEATPADVPAGLSPSGWTQRFLRRRQPTGDRRDGPRAKAPAIMAGVSALLRHGRRLAEGGYGLPVTYWGYGCGVSVAVYGLVALLLAGELLALSSTVLGFHFLYCVFVWVGIWNASSRHGGRPVWRRLAKSTVAVIAIVALAILIGMLTATGYA